VESLSGGEGARLLFARLSVEKPNVLLLDEPTNHLDMEAVQALASSVRAFEGTTIFVSHNRWFVSELATRILEIKPDGVVDFPGGYEDYLARSGDDHLDASVALRQAKVKSAAEPAGPSPDWEEQKKKRNRAKVLRDKSEKLQAAIAAKEARQKAIAAGWYEDGFYERTPPEQVKKLQEEEAAIGRELEALLSDWESTETELAEIGDA
jgi:ABC-type multidrug transport system ATPase subunit